MADLKITALPPLVEGNVGSTDALAVADLSATETKKVTVKDLIAAGVALIDDGDIPGAKVGTLGANQVTTNALQNLAVTTAKLANGAVTATKITDATITGAKLVNDTVTATQIATNAITATELADNAVDENAIANGAVTVNKIPNTTVTYAKLNLSDGDIPGAKIASGGITASQIATNAVTATELADDAVDTAAVANGAITGAKIAATTITGSNLANLTVTSGKIANGAIGTNQIADGAVTVAKLSGTLAAGSLANDAVTTAKIVDDAITSAKLAANAVDAAALANNAVDTNAIVDANVTTAKLATGAVTDAKITDGTITAAKLATANINRSLNVSSGNLGINNAITAGTRSGITYNAQGLITATTALVAGDLPVATTSAVGGISVGTGLSVSGAGALSITNSVTGATVSGITFNGQGMITAATALAASDLPTATASAKGAVQITAGGGLTVSGSGGLTTSTSGISAGTYTKVTVNNKGVATAGTTLAASDIPNLAATVLTSGTIPAARIGNDSIDGSKLSNASTALFQSIAQNGYPTAQFNGQILFDTVSEDAFIWDGNAWQAITTLTKGSLVFGGTFNAATSQMVATTSAGIAAGLAVGSNLPTPSSTTDGVYVVVSNSGTPSSPAPVVALAPPDYVLGVTNSSGSSWNEVDLSQTVAGQVASNITFTPYGQLSATNVQDALQELETEKMGFAGGTVTGELLIGNTGSLVFEGSTVDAYELTLAVTDPAGSDKTITFPDRTGTVVTTGDTNTVTSTMVDASLVNANLAANAAIDFSKLAALSSAQILVGNGSNVATAVAVTGDIGITNAGLTSITAGAIVNADVSNTAAITGSKITTGTTSAVGVLQLTDSTNSTSATTAATPAAVKTVNDALTATTATANAALPKAGGTMTGNLIVDNAKEVRFSEADSNGANYLALKAPASVASDITWILPATDSTGTQFLKSDGSGNLGWASDNATDNTKLPLTGGTLTGDLTLNAQKDLRFADADSSHYIALQSPATVASSFTLTLPSTDAAVSGYVLASDGSGTLSWVDPGSTSSPTFTGDATLTNDGALVGFSNLNATYTGNAKTLTVTVASKTGAHRYNGSGSSSGYLIGGKESPFLTLTPGRTYKFDQADSSNSGHPLRFYLEADKTTAYTTGVTTNGTAGSSGAYTQIVVSDTTPQVLHYQCSAHALMGNSVQTNSNQADLSTLNASNLASGTVATARLGTGTASSSNFLRGDGSWQTVSSDLVNDTSPQLGGDLDTNSENIIFGDSSDGTSDDVLKFGVGAGGVQDLRIYSNGSEGILETQSGGTIKIKTATGSSSTDTFATFSGPASQIDFHKSVLFIGNSKNIVWDNPNDSFYFTDNAKIRLGAGSGVAGDLLLYSDGTTAKFDGNINFNGTLQFSDGTSADALVWDPSTNNLEFKDDNKLTFGDGNDLQIWHEDTVGSHINNSHLKLYIDGYTGVVLEHNTAAKLETTATGITVTGTVVATAFTGTASLATEFTVTANNSTDETVYPLFADGATGSQGAETDTGLTYNPSTGLLTATGFSGAGTSLTALNASNLGSGTIPDARFPATLPAVSAANLTNIPATSPAGSNQQIQFNNSGSFGGSSNLYWSSNILTSYYGVNDQYGFLRDVPGYNIYSNNWVNSGTRGRCAFANGNFYLGTAATGYVASVINVTSSDITINRQTSYLYNTADGSNNSTYTLASRGMATFYWHASSTVYMTGSGIS